MLGETTKQSVAGLQLASDLKRETEEAKMNTQSMRAPKEQQQTVHRDKTGKIVTLEEKLTSSKELLQKTNKEALKQWASGAKQIDDIAKR